MNDAIGRDGTPVPPAEIVLSDLYQEVILDHNRRPRNFGKLDRANAYSHGVNPLCGDDYHLYLVVDGNGRIQEVGFEGQGCAISKSSASLMTTVIRGLPLEEAKRLKAVFLQLVMADHLSEADRSALKGLKIFEGVKKFPVRVKCATLIWHALEDALRDVKLKNDYKEES